ncbi:L,D-transpeptidase family protein [Methylomonas sp. HW2-6]|uniref:L,D-transpeptidase family protein n=1 Tax=Methylomonas sp. HW2-6 TaxID=3376687 RepID=UPI00404393FD
MTRPAATPNRIASPKALAVSALLLSQLLSGCQSLQIFQQPEPETIVWNSKAEDLPIHEFSLSPGQNMVGELASITSAENDTLSDIGRHYGLGFNDIANANAGVDPWTLSSGQNVLLPLSFILPDAPRKGIVLNLANMRMFYYPKNATNSVLTYPVGIGRQGWHTPLGQTQIVAKKANPDWTVPASIQREHQAQGTPLPKVVRSGPDNPLGDYAMPLGFSGYLIHGTNKPYGIGMQVSHGCVQLYPEDIETLFGKVKIGTPVNIVHQPYLAAWRDDMLYLEAHPPLDKWEKQTKQLQKDIRKKLQQLAAAKGAEIDWSKADLILRRADGIATPVLAGSPDLAELRANAIPLARPDKLFGQPIPSELSDSDWAIQAAVFDNATDAQKLAAMLNHQGPPIPAHKVAKDGSYQVVVGPLKNKKEVKIVAQRIKQNFDMDVTPLAPRRAAKN